MTATDIYPQNDAGRSGGQSDGTGRDSHGWPYDRARHDGPSWLNRGEAWLDDKGKGAWIAAMILGFVIFWPIGLALLAYMIWSKRMFKKPCNTNGHTASRHDYRAAMRTSGNAAFDAYKADTLRRLEEEQSNFEAFLGRLREAKDKAEFDNFMTDRARAAASGTGGQDQGNPA